VFRVCFESIVDDVIVKTTRQDLEVCQSSRPGQSVELIIVDSQRYSVVNEGSVQRKQRKAMSEQTNAKRSTVQRSQSTFDLLTQGACSRNKLVSNFVSQARLEVVVP